jgi:hypothetical protein
VELKTTLKTVTMKIFVHAEIKDRSIGGRLKRWGVRKLGQLPWMTLDEVTQVNASGSDTISEQIILGESTRAEAKLWFRNEAYPGVRTKAPRGEIAFFRKLLPQFFEADVYQDILHAAMRDASLMRASFVYADSNGNLEIARSALPNVADWVTRFMGKHPAHHYDTNILTNTQMAIMNQVLVRSLRQQLTTRVGSQEAIFRSGGRSQGARHGRARS